MPRRCDDQHVGYIKTWEIPSLAQRIINDVVEIVCLSYELGQHEAAHRIKISNGTKELMPDILKLSTRKTYEVRCKKHTN